MRKGREIARQKGLRLAENAGGRHEKIRLYDDGLGRKKIEAEKHRKFKKGEGPIAVEKSIIRIAAELGIGEGLATGENEIMEAVGGGHMRGGKKMGPTFFYAGSVGRETAGLRKQALHPPKKGILEGAGKGLN